MAKAPKTVEECTAALERAVENERKAGILLRDSAMIYSAAPDNTPQLKRAWAVLTDAAKKHTNAAHQTSRCRKWLRDAGGQA